MCSVTFCFLCISCSAEISDTSEFSSMSRKPDMITFLETFGGPEDEIGNSVCETSDGGYFCLGTRYISNGANNLVFLKVSERGQEEWYRAQNETISQRGCAAIPSGDGGFFVVGNYAYSTRLLKIDAAYSSIAEAIDANSHGGVTIVGESFYLTDEGSQYQSFVRSTDGEGNELWCFFLEKNWYNAAIAVDLMESGSHIVSIIHNSHSCTLLKYLPNGHTELLKELQNTWIYDVRQTFEGGYIAISDGPDGASSRLLKLDQSGNTEWTKDLSNGFGYTTVRQTRDSGYIIGGYSGLGVANKRINIIKTDSSGNEEWSKLFGEEGSASGCSLIQTLNNGFAFCGAIELPNEQNKDIYLGKMDENGTIIEENLIVSVDNTAAGI